ncbi:hypothetical protein TNIN_96431 [Trichonephila inaurata madagascariensis]|uniref:Uncharacterized protein n=1 Tax=Trichonephila inaurata madagascariensis TaxID=2747483 RepID=A0A8X6YCJ1_9ARAC|nr:hypothetical protein TNIN_96431 [Trichonephila inaurata madagascariensis]
MSRDAHFQRASKSRSVFSLQEKIITEMITLKRAALARPTRDHPEVEVDAASLTKNQRPRRYGTDSASTLTMPLPRTNLGHVP